MPRSSTIFCWIRYMIQCSSIDMQEKIYLCSLLYSQVSGQAKFYNLRYAEKLKKIVEAPFLGLATLLHSIISYYHLQLPHLLKTFWTGGKSIFSCKINSWNKATHFFFSRQNFATKIFLITNSMRYKYNLIPILLLFALSSDAFFMIPYIFSVCGVPYNLFQFK